MKQFLIDLWDKMFPDDCRCIICDKEIVRGSCYSVCEECDKTLPYNKGKVCLTCGKAMRNEAMYCDECQDHHMHFDFARSSFIYKDEISKLELYLKFHNRRWLAKYLSAFMYDTYVENAFDAEVIIAVPISSERLLKRGYNQAADLAKYLSEKIAISVADNVIVKHKDNVAQSELSGKSRRKNVMGAYKLVNRKLVKGKRVLVVDDVLTTGSTASEIARQLKIAGATEVYVLTFASSISIVPMEKYKKSAVIDDNK